MGEERRGVQWKNDKSKAQWREERRKNKRETEFE
jgi:hypothetical protein